MGFVKVVKNKAYFKRFQVKYKRRREGKTDYQMRRCLVTQDKNKYSSPKYRFVVRQSLKDITCQIIYAKIEGDVCLTAAYAHELKNYGVKTGLTNYASSYCVGLLAARRLLTKIGIADAYVGQPAVDGEMFIVTQKEEQKRPFCAYLDIGLGRATTGAKLFAVLKGAVDGGIEIPHNEKRLAGYSKESKKLDAATLKARIFGTHVGEYIDNLAENDLELMKRQFASYVSLGLVTNAADSIPAMYKAAHAAIRANPVYTKKTHTKPAAGVKNKYVKNRLTYAERKNKIKQKIVAFNAKQAEEK